MALACSDFSLDPSPSYSGGSFLLDLEGAKLISSSRPCTFSSPRLSHGWLPSVHHILVLGETFLSTQSSKDPPDHPQAHCPVPLSSSHPLLALLSAAPKSRAFVPSTKNIPSLYRYGLDGIEWSWP